jgi:hypothetical protein
LKLIGRRAHHHVAGLLQLALDHGIGESCDGIRYWCRRLPCSR